MCIRDSSSAGHVWWVSCFVMAASSCRQLQSILLAVLRALCYSGPPNTHCVDISTPASAAMSRSGQLQVTLSLAWLQGGCYGLDICIPFSTWRTSRCPRLHQCWYSSCVLQQRRGSFTSTAGDKGIDSSCVAVCTLHPIPE